MTGICAGIKGKVQLGDLVISDLSFDSGSGKVTQDGNGAEKFEPDFKSLPLSGDLKQSFIELSMNKSVLRQIKDLWKGNSVSNELVLHLGPVGSGAGVIANQESVEKIRSFQRKLTAIDMETYAIFYCSHYANNPKPTAISIKAVSDFADANKSDDIQKYCSFVSARLADYIIKNHLIY
jgi:nucleoside phosphorylase